MALWPVGNIFHIFIHAFLAFACSPIAHFPVEHSLQTSREISTVRLCTYELLACILGSVLYTPLHFPIFIWRKLRAKYWECINFTWEAAGCCSTQLSHELVTYLPNLYTNARALVQHIKHSQPKATWENRISSSLSSSSFSLRAHARNFPWSTTQSCCVLVAV